MTDKSFTTTVAWREGEDASWIEWQCTLCNAEFAAGVAAYLLFGDLWLCASCGDKNRPAKPR